MKTCIYDRLETTRNLHKRVPLVGGGTGFTTVPDGAESLTYMVTVDLEQLKQMARKAAGNKGQVAVDGPLEVAVMSRRRL
jgi:hypothetical protein